MKKSRNLSRATFLTVILVQKENVSFLVLSFVLVKATNARFFIRMKQRKTGDIFAKFSHKLKVDRGQSCANSSHEFAQTNLLT